MTDKPPTEALDWIALSGRRAKGKRPEYFDDPAVDRLYSLSLALVAEVSTLRERLDTVERLLETRGTLKQDDIEHYVPDLDAGRARAEATRAYIARVMRRFQQDVEALQANDRPIPDIIADLGRE